MKFEVSICGSQTVAYIRIITWGNEHRLLGLTHWVSDLQSLGGDQEFASLTSSQVDSIAEGERFPLWKPNFCDVQDSFEK